MARLIASLLIKKLGQALATECGVPCFIYIVDFVYLLNQRVDSIVASYNDVVIVTNLLDLEYFTVERQLRFVFREFSDENNILSG